MTDDEGEGRRRPIERPVTTAERVVAAIRDGVTTVDDIVRHTGLNPSVVGITLTALTRNEVVVRARASYSAKPGPRPYVYGLTPAPPDTSTQVLRVLREGGPLSVAEMRGAVRWVGVGRLEGVLADLAAAGLVKEVDGKWVAVRRGP